MVDHLIVMLQVRFNFIRDMHMVNDMLCTGTIMYLYQYLWNFPEEYK